MSAMMGNGDDFLISTMAWAASRVGTATRTIRQLASFRRAISLRVALTSRVSALVIDWTTISAAPPTTTSPIRTGIDFRLGLISTHRYMSLGRRVQTTERGRRNAPPAREPDPLVGRGQARAPGRRRDRRRARGTAGCSPARG